ncbi:MAG: S-layer homology domain-containing protein [Candidatus Pristimantibacillus lignocellulolyticus]|uniref:S-layer homology domain-containing protein n=1 Tax=Candidatus Pristimantibacillus lignocellulolyticus TaxID=2994561 RepID=A0A9J6ZKP3_9BACL|nr:MAG: S-layer homology domain-containing protein [Candidatus Pristimantibacillus lignocellulolyticus]
MRDIQSLSAQLGSNGNLKDLKIVIKIAKPSDETVKKVEDTITANGLAIVAAPLSFTISANYGNASIDINNFNSYVERTITIPEGIDPTQITTGIVIEADGSIRHIPTNIEKIDGQYIARINSLTNVVQTAYAYGLINGFQDGTFGPEKSITREQAMVIISKAMLLTDLPGVAHGSSAESIVGAYKDGNQVASWAVVGVADAISAGIVSGKVDNSLAPQAAITRAEVAVIIERLLQNSDLINKEPVK